MRSCPPEALTGSSGSVLRWTRMLLGHGVDNPLLRGSRGFRPVRGCRNHMNDLVAAAFELVENFGQREDGAGVNIVQQQDALAARLDTADGASRNLAIVDAGPVVRQKICAPRHIAMGREVLLDRLLAQQTRYPKERRHRLRVPDGLAQRRKTLFDLASRLIHGHFANGVVLGVVGNSVALVINAPHHPWIGARHLPDHEEGRLHTFRCEGLEDAVGVARQRPIVERQHDLMIIKRQRFGVLHGANTGMLIGVDHECTADPERARWALLGICRADQQNQNGARRNGSAHDPVSAVPPGSVMNSRRSTASRASDRTIAHLSSGYRERASKCLLRAKSGLIQCNQWKSPFGQFGGDLLRQNKRWWLSKSRHDSRVLPMHTSSKKGKAVACRIATSFAAVAMGISCIATDASATCKFKAKKDIIVILDVGHTDKDSGQISARGVKEYDLNMKLARRVLEELVNTGFISTQMIVTSGSNTHESRVQRSKRANDLGADLFISVHHDGVKNETLMPWQYNGKTHWFLDKFEGFSLWISQKNNKYEESLSFATTLADRLMASGLKFTAHHVELTNTAKYGRVAPLVDREQGIYDASDHIAARGSC